MRTVPIRSLVLVSALLLIASTAWTQGRGKKPAWAMNATIIEACSCPMFCQCYFSTKPAAHASHDSHGDHGGHGEEHFCRFNNAFQINKGHHAGTSLDGVRFWVYGDLGSEFDDGEMEWAVLTFDRTATPAQREAIAEIAGHLYPVAWKSFGTAEGVIEWKAGASESRAVLDGGRTAEVTLTTASLNRNEAGAPMVLKNLRYWGAPRNDGFVMMPNVVQAVRTGDRAFEYRGTNGFMITVDINANDVLAAGGAHGK